MAMIECPRCGFAQPTDKYCASCGVDMEALLAKPVPFWKRTMQNPNLHLSMIGILILVVIGWIFYTQRALVNREMGAFLDSPVLSKEAADPGSDPVRAQAPMPVAATRGAIAASEGAEAEFGSESTSFDTADQSVSLDSAGSEVGAAGSPSPTGRLVDGSKMEVTFWEIPREQLAQVISRAEKDSSEGAFTFKQGEEVLKGLRQQAESLGVSRSANVTSGTAMLNVETPASAPENFQFALRLQLGENLRVESSQVFPTEAGSPYGTPSQGPNASVPVAKDSLMLLVFDVPQRNVREETLSKAGEGPWSVFASPEFKVGMTEWIATIHFK